MARPRMDITGKRFGKLTALIPTWRGKDTAWYCDCDCGGFRIATVHDLTTDHCKKCDQCMALDLTGQTFGKLLVLPEPIHFKKNGQSTWMWKCKCACGNFTEVYAGHLTNGHTKSCGCLKNARRLSPEDILINRAIGGYKTSAKNRNLCVELSRKQFIEFFSGNCFYCGIPPSTIFELRKIHPNSRFIYNGIDRVDGTKGYTMENCVSCCKMCNYAKRTNSLPDFITWIKRISKHLKKQKTEIERLIAQGNS